jgi:hypothetical protein
MRLAKFANLILLAYIVFTNVIIFIFVAPPFVFFQVPFQIDSRSDIGDAIFFAAFIGCGAFLWLGHRCVRDDAKETLGRLAVVCLFGGLLLSTAIYFIYAFNASDVILRKMWLAQAVGMLVVSWLILFFVIRRAQKMAKVANYSGPKTPPPPPKVSGTASTKNTGLSQ